jgi:hypothetical protein
MKVLISIRVSKITLEKYGDFDLCPSQEIIITIFSDRDYMQGLYNRLLFIKAMGR